NAVRLVSEGDRAAPVIRVVETGGPAADAAAILARAEVLTAQDSRVLRIHVEAGSGAVARLLVLGAARRAGEGVEILPGLLWQCADRWLPAGRPPFPELFTVTQGRRHPLRPEVPAGTVYARTIPWL
ncbi:acetyltransferase, partial|nr:acetyltransferase [Escherichia coli]